MREDFEGIILKTYIVYCQGVGEVVLNELEVKLLLEADKRNVRFIQFSRAIINPAFVTSIKEKVEYRTFEELEMFPLLDYEKKFIVDRKVERLTNDSKRLS